MVEIIRLKSYLPDEVVEQWRANYIDGRHCERLIDYDADVYKPDGSPLLKFRRGVLDGKVCGLAYTSLYLAAVTSTNRGDAAGGSYYPLKKDGTYSRTRQSDPVLSGIMGSFDEPVCRVTEYTAKDVKHWHRVLPFILAVNDVFQSELPDRYVAQMEAVRETPSAYIIPGTVFSTVTVNRNWRTAVHKDKGDLQEGFGVMSVVESGLRGSYEGGYLCFPKYGLPLI
jgi:hypothetical protein